MFNQSPKQVDRNQHHHHKILLSFVSRKLSIFATIYLVQSLNNGLEIPLNCGVSKARRFQLNKMKYYIYVYMHVQRTVFNGHIVFKVEV